MWAHQSVLLAWNCEQHQRFSRSGARGFKQALHEAVEIFARPGLCPEDTTPLPAEQDSRLDTAKHAPPAVAVDDRAGSAPSASDAHDDEFRPSESSSSEVDNSMDEDAETAYGYSSKRQTKRQLVGAARKQLRQATKPAHADNMWQALEQRKWRPPATMYSSELHVALRGQAQQELSTTANYQSLHVRADLSEAKKVLPSDGEARVQKRVAVLMVAEIIPPAAIAAMCARPLEELTPERVIFAIQTSMGNLSPDGTIKSVYGFLKFWDWLRKTGRSFDKISHLDVNEYLSMIHDEATQQPGASAGDGADILIGVEMSDLDVLPEDADEHDPFLEKIEGEWRGHSAASGQRSLLVRLEKNSQFPIGAVQSRVPQVGQGARLTAPRRHATAPSPLAFRAVQTYVERDDTDPIMANIGWSFLLSGVSTKRAIQLQNISFYAEMRRWQLVVCPRKTHQAKVAMRTFSYISSGWVAAINGGRSIRRSCTMFEKGSSHTGTTTSWIVMGRDTSVRTLGRPTDRPIVRCLHGRLPMRSDTCSKKPQACLLRKSASSPNIQVVPFFSPAAKCAASLFPGSSSSEHGSAAAWHWTACPRTRSWRARRRWYRHEHPTGIAAPVPQHSFSSLSRRTARRCTN